MFNVHTFKYRVQYIESQSILFYLSSDVHRHVYVNILRKNEIKVETGLVIEVTS